MNKYPFLRLALYWGPVLLYAAVIFGFSSLSAVPEMPNKSDEILHFLEYFFFALLLWRAFAREHFWSLQTTRVLAVALIASLYGASDELHQSYVPGRYASIYDWFADVAGILGMLTLMVIRLKWRDRDHQYEIS